MGGGYTLFVGELRLAGSGASPTLQQQHSLKSRGLDAPMSRMYKGLFHYIPQSLMVLLLLYSTRVDESISRPVGFFAVAKSLTAGA